MTGDPRPGLTRRAVKELMARHDITPSRALGQNFMVEPDTARRIVRLAGVAPGDSVVEIGAGFGSLTVVLADAGARVVAVERDRRLVAALREVVPTDGVEVVEADALALDWRAVLASAPRWSLVANLPYNIATPLVLDVLAGVPAVERMVVLVQREVARRLAAEPGSRDYGVPSVMVAYRARARVLTTVSADCFLPRPRVESALVEIERRPVPAVTADPERLDALVRAAFGQRRKTLRRSLAALVDVGHFARAGVDPADRPERLSIEDWGRLAEAMSAADEDS